MRCEITDLRISSDCWTETAQNKIKTTIKEVHSRRSPDTKNKMKPAIPHSLQLKSKPIEICRQWFVLRWEIWAAGIFNRLSTVKSKSEGNDSLNKAGMNLACDEDPVTRLNQGSVEWPGLPTPGIKRKMHSNR